MKNELERFEALKPGVADVIDAMFDMANGMQEYGLSIADLREACELAIEDGYQDTLTICLSMMSIAVEESKRKEPPHAR